MPRADRRSGHAPPGGEKAEGGRGRESGSATPAPTAAKPRHEPRPASRALAARSRSRRGRRVDARRVIDPGGRTRHGSRPPTGDTDRVPLRAPPRQTRDRASRPVADPAGFSAIPPPLTSPRTPAEAAAGDGGGHGIEAAPASDLPRPPFSLPHLPTAPQHTGSPGRNRPARRPTPHAQARPDPPLTPTRRHRQPRSRRVPRGNAARGRRRLGTMRERGREGRRPGGRSSGRAGAVKREARPGRGWEEGGEGAGRRTVGGTHVGGLPTTTRLRPTSPQRQAHASGLRGTKGPTRGGPCERTPSRARPPPRRGRRGKAIDRQATLRQA